jgi:hypothetical protein
MQAVSAQHDAVMQDKAGERDMPAWDKVDMFGDRLSQITALARIMDAT